jgi:monoamine oxidase
MDKIGKAFARKVDRITTYNAEVIEISKLDNGVRVNWTDRRRNITRSEQAKFLICTIPLSVLRKIKSNFRAEVRSAIGRPPYRPAGKVAFQAERRFWEIDDQLYGGISWINKDIKQIWYPSAGFHAAKGILVGAYIWDYEPGGRFADKTHKLRLEDALRAMKLSELARHDPSAKRGKVDGRVGPRGPVAPKYRNPKDTSQTWAGRGLQPLWVREAIKAGKKLDSFLIK